MAETQTQPTIESLKNDSNENIKRTAKEISELSDKTTDNDNVELSWVLTKEFSESLNQDTAQILLNEANKIKTEKTSDQQIYTDLDDLITFLDPIANPHKVPASTDTEAKKTNENGEESQETPTSVLDKFSDFFWDNWSLNTLPDGLDENTKNAIKNIKTALENPTKKNIQIVQDFLYNYINNNDQKNDFFNKNKADKNQSNYENNKWVNNWDGNIWNCTKDKIWKFIWLTAKTLNDFLTKTADYVENVKKQQQVIEKHDKEIKDETDKINNLLNGITDKSDYDTAKTNYDEAKAKYDEATEKYPNFDKENKLSNKLKEAEDTLKTLKKNKDKQETQEKAESSTLSFDELSKKLQDLNNDDINGILNRQLTPLNEKLKKWDSIKKLKAEKAKLEWEKQSYDKDGDGIDKEEMKWNRKDIKELEKNINKLETQIKEKENIIQNIKAQLDRIKEIVHNNDTLAKEFYGLSDWDGINTIYENPTNKTEKARTPFSQFERNLENIWEDQPAEAEKTEKDEIWEWEKAEKDPEKTATKTTPEKLQRAKKSMSFKEFLEKINGFNREKWKWLIGNLVSLFTYMAWWQKDKLFEEYKDNKNIDLDSTIVREVLTLVQDTTNVNWIESIKSYLQDGSENAIRQLQMALWTEHNWMKINGKIDKNTAEILKAYIKNEENKWRSPNLEFQCLKWWEKVTKEEVTFSDTDGKKTKWLIYKKNLNGAEKYILQWTINWNECMAFNINYTEASEKTPAKISGVDGENTTILYLDWRKETWKFNENRNLTEWKRETADGKEEAVKKQTAEEGA